VRVDFTGGLEEEDLEDLILAILEKWGPHSSKGGLPRTWRIAEKVKAFLPGVTEYDVHCVLTSLKERGLVGEFRGGIPFGDKQPFRVWRLVRDELR